MYTLDMPILKDASKVQLEEQKSVKYIIGKLIKKSETEKKPNVVKDVWNQGLSHQDTQKKG